MRSQHGAGGLSLYSLINKKNQVTESAWNESYLELEVLRDLVGDLVTILIPILVSRPTSRSNPRPDATNRWLPLGLCSNVTLDIETQFQCPERPLKAEKPFVLEGTSWRLVQVSAFHNLAFWLQQAGRWQAGAAGAVRNFNPSLPQDSDSSAGHPSPPSQSRNWGFNLV